MVFVTGGVTWGECISIKRRFRRWWFFAASIVLLRSLRTQTHFVWVDHFLSARNADLASRKPWRCCLYGISHRLTLSDLKSGKERSGDIIKNTDNSMIALETRDIRPSYEGSERVCVRERAIVTRQAGVNRVRQRAFRWSSHAFLPQLPLSIRSLNLLRDNQFIAQLWYSLFYRQAFAVIICKGVIFSTCSRRNRLLGIVTACVIKCFTHPILIEPNPIYKPTFSLPNLRT